MSAKNLLTGTNVMFLLATIYFIVVALLGEGSTYSVAGAILCSLAIIVSFWQTIISGPWRVATASFSLVLFVVQLAADLASSDLYNATTLGSTLINGAFFLLFLGVLLSTARDILRRSTEEEDQEKPKESKKLTYEI